MNSWIAINSEQLNPSKKSVQLWHKTDWRHNQYCQFSQDVQQLPTILRQGRPVVWKTIKDRPQFFKIMNNTIHWISHSSTFNHKKVIFFPVNSTPLIDQLGPVYNSQSLKKQNNIGLNVFFLIQLNVVISNSNGKW